MPKIMERGTLQVTIDGDAPIQRAGVRRRLVQDPAETRFEEDRVMDILRGLVNVARTPVYQEREVMDEEDVVGVGVEEIPGEVETPPEGGHEEMEGREAEGAEEEVDGEAEALPEEADGRGDEGAIEGVEGAVDNGRYDENDENVRDIFGSSSDEEWVSTDSEGTGSEEVWDDELPDTPQSPSDEEDRGIVWVPDDD